MVKEQITFTLDSDIRAALNRQAELRRWTPSQTIREAIYRFLLSEERTITHSLPVPHTPCQERT
jgi:predicted transcriptional regulator